MKKLISILQEIKIKPSSTAKIYRAVYSDDLYKIDMIINR